MTEMTDEELVREHEQSVMKLRMAAEPRISAVTHARCLKAANETRNLLLSRLAALRAEVPRWISVEERLPQPYKLVLVYVTHENGDPFQDTACVNRDGVWIPNDTGSATVTHWMPLPTAPNGTEAE